MNVLVTGQDSFVRASIIKSLQISHNVIGVDLFDLDNTKHQKSYNEEIIKYDKSIGIDVFICIDGLYDNHVYTQQQKDIIAKRVRKSYDYFLFSKAYKYMYIRPLYIEGQDNLTFFHLSSSSYTESDEYLFMSSKSINKKVYILQTSLIYGPNFPCDLFQIFLRLSKGIPVILDAGRCDSQFSLTSIGNIEYIISRTIIDDIPSGTYNIVDDSTVSIADFVRIIQIFLGHKGCVVKLPKRIVRFFSSLNLPIFGLHILRQSNNMIASNRNLLRVLKIRSMPYSVQTDFIDTLQSYRKMEKIN